MNAESMMTSSLQASRTGNRGSGAVLIMCEHPVRKLPVVDEPSARSNRTHR